MHVDARVQVLSPTCIVCGQLDFFSFAFALLGREYSFSLNCPENSLL